jgi:hypothetical protein
MDKSFLDRYRERWIALTTDGDVLADAEQIDELLDLLDARGLKAAQIQRIPAANEPLFVGLR